MAGEGQDGMCHLGAVVETCQCYQRESDGGWALAFWGLAQLHELLGLVLVLVLVLGYDCLQSTTDYSP